MRISYLGRSRTGQFRPVDDPLASWIIGVSRCGRRNTTTALAENLPMDTWYCGWTGVFPVGLTDPLGTRFARQPPPAKSRRSVGKHHDSFFTNVAVDSAGVAAFAHRIVYMVLHDG